MLKVERIPEVYLQHIIKSHIFSYTRPPYNLHIRYGEMSVGTRLRCHFDAQGLRYKGQ